MLHEKRIEIRDADLSVLLKRLPDFELSYETVTHTKVPNDYDIILAIPQGKKYLVWFTFYENRDRAIWFSMSKDKQITQGFYYNIEIPQKLALGTVLYGTLLDDKFYYIIEDIFFYAGVSLKRAIFKEKANFIYLFSHMLNKTNSTFAVPFMTTDMEHTERGVLPRETINKIGYPIHHLQCRSFHFIKPYANIGLSKKPLNRATTDSNSSSQITKKTHDFDTITFRMDFTKPQYRYPTVFQVTADIQYDIYHLFAYGFTNRPVYYGIACVPNYKTSVMMNSLFRKIRENQDLDAIEESDDEEDFQNTSEDKYVNLTKVLLMECMFHTKWKKWVPIRVVPMGETRYIHIRRLISSS
jgi:hypothetical protein